MVCLSVHTLFTRIESLPKMLKLVNNSILPKDNLFIMLIFIFSYSLPYNLFCRSVAHANDAKTVL